MTDPSISCRSRGGATILYVDQTFQDPYFQRCDLLMRKYPSVCLPALLKYKRKFPATLSSRLSVVGHHPHRLSVRSEGCLCGECRSHNRKACTRLKRDQRILQVSPNALQAFHKCKYQAKVHATRAPLHVLGGQVMSARSTSPSCE